MIISLNFGQEAVEIFNQSTSSGMLDAALGFGCFRWDLPASLPTIELIADLARSNLLRSLLVPISGNGFRRVNSGKEVFFREEISGAEIELDALFATFNPPSLSPESRIKQTATRVRVRTKLLRKERERERGCWNNGNKREGRVVEKKR